MPGLDTDPLWGSVDARPEAFVRSAARFKDKVANMGLTPRQAVALIGYVTPLAANRFAEDPLLYTTPNYHVKKGYPNTDGVNNVLSANRFAAKRFMCRGGSRGFNSTQWGSIVFLIPPSPPARALHGGASCVQMSRRNQEKCPPKNTAPLFRDEMPSSSSLLSITITKGAALLPAGR